MAFKVEILRAAEQDILEAAAFINADSPPEAQKWLAGLVAAITSLSELPLRHPLVSEAHELGYLLRSFPYHSYRIVYNVNEARQTVSIVRVYHSARRPLRKDDIETI